MRALDIFKCLSDQTRLKCLLLVLREQELCVCEFTEALGEIQPKISRHLALLKKTGLLTDKRQGQWVYYKLDPTLPAWVNAVLQQTADNNLLLIEENMAKLNKMGDRPARRDLCAPVPSRS
jgi:ArsR family transcriptional regulator, arsenate/arsenite/antimonite-responsive transcriptional repressor